MTSEPRLDIIGAALGDPSRARILCELMDGRAFTNKELASAAGITAQTASAHLGRLGGAGLTTSLRSGRHVYYRIASAEVAEVLEALATLSPRDHLARTGPKGDDTRRARSCYNHLAGRLGVQIAERLCAMQVLEHEGESEALRPGARYGGFVRELGLDVAPRRGAQPVARLCLDWSERRHHISGPLAIAIMQKALTMGWLERRRASRALIVTAPGVDAFRRWFGLSRDDLEQEFDR